MTLEEAKALNPGQTIFLSVTLNGPLEEAVVHAVYGHGIHARFIDSRASIFITYDQEFIQHWRLVPPQPPPCLVGRFAPKEE